MKYGATDYTNNSMIFAQQVKQGGEHFIIMHVIFMCDWIYFINNWCFLNLFNRRMYIFECRITIAENCNYITSVFVYFFPHIFANFCVIFIL